MSQPRLVPMVILAASALLGLKILALAQGNLHALAAGTAKPPAAADPFEGVVPDPIITNSGGGGGHGGDEEAKPAAAPAAEHASPSVVRTSESSTKPPEAKPIPGSELLSEIEILKRLAERRKKLDKLEEDLMMRENLLKATEERVEKRVEDLKQVETRSATTGKTVEEEKKKQVADLVKVYEAMKPKDAARVFEGLDPTFVADLARQMNAKKLADIVAKMSSESAQRLTVELARANMAQPQAPVAAPTPSELPKIQGKS